MRAHPFLRENHVGRDGRLFFFFNQLIEEAYAVIFAGGTLSPFSHISSELLHCLGNGDDQSQMLRDAAAADYTVSKSFFPSVKPFAQSRRDASTTKW